MSDTTVENMISQIVAGGVRSVQEYHSKKRMSHGRAAFARTDNRLCLDESWQFVRLEQANALLGVACPQIEVVASYFNPEKIERQ